MKYNVDWKRLGVFVIIAGSLIIITGSFLLSLAIFLLLFVVEHLIVAWDEKRKKNKDL
ncbi:hypothetical protein HMPREF0663_12143 [Hoylesella oralis ATCC 33269]|uniref:Uncharacterized protein n=1 Tax=Hoylesella oralis ATCC 33269 TaxID=873533 RepID=E7RS75_9BACT|nr:hypothetical protein [Hoylesella oralis]EFZ36076.1 hypothetical protein HMPREF0663_12143 [Hoylesella oralis ATCC 33269]SHG05365.1 hypothetical protein SAMN05444288_2254 [Hoylesella oralis]